MVAIQLTVIACSDEFEPSKRHRREREREREREVSRSISLASTRQ